MTKEVVSWADYNNTKNWLYDIFNTNTNNRVGSQTLIKLSFDPCIQTYAKHWRFMIF